MNLLETSLEQISQEIPGATAIMNHYNLSFCCGGKKSLQEAIEGANIEQNEILGSLLKLIDQSGHDVNWDESSIPELIIYLKGLGEKISNIQLPELFRLADRVETVHGNKPHCPVGLAEQLSFITEKLKEQSNQENESLFPTLMKDETKIEPTLINKMRLNLDEVVVAIIKVDELTNNISTPDGACNTWRALYLGLKAFKVDIQQYIHIENDVLFAHLDSNTSEQVESKTHGEDFCCGSCGGS